MCGLCDVTLWRPTTPEVGELPLGSLRSKVADAGTLRTDGGLEHQVEGKGVVKALCTHLLWIVKDGDLTSRFICMACKSYAVYASACLCFTYAHMCLYKKYVQDRLEHTHNTERDFLFKSKYAFPTSINRITSA